MHSSTLYSSDSSVYPGVYVPMLKEEEIREKLNSTPQKNIIPPMVSMIELKDAYKIEIALPGIERDGLLIYATGNILSVCAVDPENRINHNNNIYLPQNVDTEFVSATFNEGLLRLYFSKTHHPVKSLYTRIVVY